MLRPLPPIHQHLGEARGAHDWADHEWVAPWMRDIVGVVLVEGDGRLGPSKPCQGGEGVNNIHLLLRCSGTVDRSHHLLPMVLSVLVLLVVAPLG